MKRILFNAGLAWGIAGAVWGATSPIYIIDAPLTAPPASPQVDATAFVNQSTFSYTSMSGNPLPFMTLNTLFFTNRASGIMSGDPGFRFDFFSGNVRDMMDTWVSQGSISVDTLANQYVGSFLTPSGSWLLVAATNILSTGPLNAGTLGLIRLHGKSIDVRRNGIRVGPSLTNQYYIGGGYLYASNYYNEVGVTDLYWGAGNNNALDNSGQPMRIDGLSYNPTFDLPFPRSPYHQVIDSSFGYLFTNTISLPAFGYLGYNSYGAYAYTNQTGPTNFTVQVVFVPTNQFDTNVTTTVRFSPSGYNGGATVVVGFSSTDFDIVTETYMTNSVYLVDGLAFVTNVFLARNLADPTRRPDTYEVTRSTPYNFYYGSPGNALFTNTLLYNTSYRSNTVRVRYAAYAAQIAASETIQATTGSLALSDPTNFPGRVEIIGDRVNLDRTRIRAETTVIVKAKDLTSNRVAKVDAPYVNLHLGSTLPELVISNVAPATVRRLSGQIAAWSGTWENMQTNGTATNEIAFHVLIVDPALQFVRPVLMNELVMQATNVLIRDTLNVGTQFELDAQGLDIRGGLTLPYGTDWSAANVRGLLNYTNRGSVYISGAAVYGEDRPEPYQNFVNSGTNVAASQHIRSLNVENTGILQVTGGLLSVDAQRVWLSGTPALWVTNLFTNYYIDSFLGTIITNYATNITLVGSRIEGSADIEIRADSLLASNSYILAGNQGQGALVLSVTNELADAGPSQTNTWTMTAGFNLIRRPARGDLFYTHITSKAARFIGAFHTWAAEDRGASPSAFTNNLTIGHLTLDGGEFSLFRFDGIGTNDALYVDYIEFQNNALNFDDPSVLEVGPNLTIYFAHANVPAEKLDGLMDGRFVWVRDYAGPNSCTNVYYPNLGTTNRLNLSLVISKDIDSDGDGIPNFYDPEPVLLPESYGLQVLYLAGPPPRAVLSWNAMAYATNYLEYDDSVLRNNWTALTNFVQGAVTARVTYEDVVTAEGMRVYRVRQDPR